MAGRSKQPKKTIPIEVRPKWVEVQRPKWGTAQVKMTKDQSDTIIRNLLKAKDTAKLGAIAQAITDPTSLDIANYHGWVKHTSLATKFPDYFHRFRGPEMESFPKNFNPEEYGIPKLWWDSIIHPAFVEPHEMPVRIPRARARSSSAGEGSSQRPAKRTKALSSDNNDEDSNEIADHLQETKPGSTSNRGRLAGTQDVQATAPAIYPETRSFGIAASKRMSEEGWMLEDMQKAYLEASEGMFAKITSTPKLCVQMGKDLLGDTEDIENLAAVIDLLLDCDRLDVTTREALRYAKGIAQKLLLRRSALTTEEEMALLDSSTGMKKGMKPGQGSSQVAAWKAKLDRTTSTDAVAKLLERLNAGKGNQGQAGSTMHDNHGNEDTSQAPILTAKGNQQAKSTEVKQEIRQVEEIEKEMEEVMEEEMEEEKEMESKSTRSYSNGGGRCQMA